MKTEKKFIICCNSENDVTIKVLFDEMSAGQKEKKIQDHDNEIQFQLMDRLEQRVESLEQQKEAVLQEAILQGKVKADDTKAAKIAFDRAIKGGKIKFDDTLFEDCMQGYKKAELKKHPVYESFKKIRDKIGDFKGSPSECLDELRSLLDAENKRLSKAAKKTSKMASDIMFCCSYNELNNAKSINNHYGLVVPCELSWDAERTDCENTQYAGISLAQRLREDGVMVPIVFTSFTPCEHIIKTRKDAEIIRTPALQHKYINMLLISGWKDILRSFNDMRPLNQAELKYTQLLYCSLRGMLVQIKHSISSSSNKDEFRGQIKYVLDKKFKDNLGLIDEFNQTDNLELFCQKLINMMDNPEETMSKSKEDDTEFICNEGEEPISIVYLEDNEKDSYVQNFCNYIDKMNLEVEKKNRQKEKGERKEKCRFARPVIVTDKESLVGGVTEKGIEREGCYKNYNVIIADIDIKNEKKEVVALGFEVVRHLIEDLGALSHVYYIVTNVTRSFYDQIKIPGISRIRLKEEVFGSDEKINRFLYGLKEAVDSKQSPKSDCQFIFEKLYAYVKNESNYPVWYKFNYMTGREELKSSETQSGYDMLEMVVRTETAKLVRAFLLGFVKSNSSNNCLLKDKALYNTFNKACESMQVYIGGEKDEETGEKTIGNYGRGNSALVKTMMKKKNDSPTPSNVNAFMVRLILRRFFLYVREFIKYYQIKTIGDCLNKDGRELSIDDLACRAIGSKGLYKEYDEDGPSQTKCLTETLMLTEDENKLESLRTDEEKKFVAFLTEHKATYLDYSNKRRIEAINFNY